MALLTRLGVLCGIRSLSTTTIRGSRYPASYIEPPAVDPKVLEEFKKTPEGDELVFTPVKAVRSEVSSSVLYDPLLEKFINNLMKRGDKKKADVLVKQALFHIKFIKPPQFEHPLAVLEAAIKNATPCLQLTDIRRGGITYEVPVPVNPGHARQIAMKWLFNAAADKERHIRFSHKLAKEIVDASLNVGRAIKFKQEIHRKAEANKAYAHYRWG